MATLLVCYAAEPECQKGVARLAQPLKVFVSHSHEDDVFCRALVRALQQAGVDVWYDEQNLAVGGTSPAVKRELLTRPDFVVILSPAALHAPRVEEETRQAHGLLRADPRRTMVPVLATPLPDEGAVWLFLQNVTRIELPGALPYSREEAVRHTLSVLALIPAGDSPAPMDPRPTEGVDNLIARGKALRARGKHAEALPLFERATRLAPGSSDAWANLGYTLNTLDRCEESLDACDRALARDDKQAWIWTTKGKALGGLGLYDEEWTAYKRAVATYERALALDPSAATAWTNTGLALCDLGRYREALATHERALALDPGDAEAWVSQGIALHGLKRHEEALVAYERAVALEPKYARAWINKSLALGALDRTAEAKAAQQWAQELDG